MTTEVLGLPRGRALTRDDLDSMPDDGHRYELLDGVLVVSPSPRWIHQRVSVNLVARLYAVCTDDLEILHAPFDVVLADDTVLQPDALVVRRSAFNDRALQGPPELAVEVLSPSTRGVDLLLKKERLQRAGCGHYWVVDPDEPSITAWALRDGEYEVVGRATGDEELDVTQPFEVSLVPVALLD
ncbi:Uma2 family endonuclease [Gordonia sp. (in: high G+C Gram-positive bacteria)]|uniref:Uma2 family endonuclease n=1 Tax=Gordonia sp. (in: high G+C Gram-positive bacteria) TaxID=84139 RepID=UPI0039E3A6BA